MTVRIATIFLFLCVVLNAQETTSTKPDAELSKKIDALISEFSADDFDTREKAYAALLKIGKPALPALVESSKSKNAEIQSWSERLVLQLGWHWESAYAKLKLTEHIEADTEPTRIDSEVLQKLFPKYRFYLKEAVRGQVGTYRARYAIKLLQEDAIRLKEDNAPGVGSDQVKQSLEAIVAIARDSGVKLAKKEDVAAFHRAIQPVLWSEWINQDPKIERTKNGWKITADLTYIMEIDKDDSPEWYYVQWNKK
jgi:hypothetical protein